MASPFGYHTGVEDPVGRDALKLISFLIQYYMARIVFEITHSFFIYQFGGNESCSKWYLQHDLIPPPTGSLLLECCFLLFAVCHGIFPVTTGSTRFRDKGTCATTEINLVL